MSILEELWYGNIEPTEYDTSPCKEYKKALQLVNRNEEELHVLPVCRQCEGISGYGRVSDVPEQFPFRCKNDAGDYGRITNDITAAPTAGNR